MKIVLDTNVLVSDLLSSRGAPARVIDMAAAGLLHVCFDSRILDEYYDVLSRPRFQLDKNLVAVVLQQIQEAGHRVAARPLALTLPDPDDLMFVEVATAGAAECIVSGNLRHFRADARLGVKILSPKALLDRLRESHNP